MMFSGYATSDFADPAAAALSMCSVFEDYSDELIKFATDPKTGVQRKHKWPPKIAEVVEFCDERMAYVAQMNRFRNWGKNDTLMLEGPREEKPTREEMEAKYGKHWGIDQTDGRVAEKVSAPSWDRIVEQMQLDPSIVKRLIAPMMKRNAK